MTSDLTKQLEKDVATQQAVVLDVFARWRADQAEVLRNFLTQEAKLTVLNQAEQTKSIAAEIPGLRERLTAAADRAAAGVLAWSSAATAEQILGYGRKLAQAYRDQADVEVIPWIQALIEAGYDSGVPKYQQLKDSPKWQWYVPSTGTARSGYVPVSEGVGGYIQASDALSEVNRKLAVSREKDARDEAENLWGD